MYVQKNYANSGICMVSVIVSKELTDIKCATP